MAKGEGKLQRKACGVWLGKSIQRLLNGAAAAVRLVEGDVAALEDVLQDNTILIAIEELTRDPQAWIGYALDRAGVGQLLGSVGQPVEWYVVTHKGPCSGKRTTTTRSAQIAGEGLGVMLSSPSIVKLNPSVNVTTLFEWEKSLRDGGMRGLQPVIGSIAEGFQKGARIWPSSTSSGPRFGGLAERKRWDKFKGKDQINVTASVIAGGLGFVAAGPAGAVVGAALGAILPTNKES